METIVWATIWNWSTTPCQSRRKRKLACLRMSKKYGITSDTGTQTFSMWWCIIKQTGVSSQAVKPSSTSTMYSVVDLNVYNSVVDSSCRLKQWHPASMPISSLPTSHCCSGKETGHQSSICFLEDPWFSFSWSTFRRDIRLSKSNLGSPSKVDRQITCS